MTNHTLNYSDQWDNDDNVFGPIEPQLGRFACFCGMFFISLVSLMGNGVTVYIYTRPGAMSAINFLIIGLTLADMCFAVLSTTTSFPFGLYYLSGDLKAYLPSQAYATTFGYPLTMITRTVSIWTMILITVDRFYAVVYPFKALQRCSIRSSVYSYLAVVGFAILYNLCRFWEYRWNDDYGVLLADAQLKADPIYLEVYVLWLYMIVMYLIPFLIICALNLKVILQLRLAGRRRLEMAGWDKATLQGKPKVKHCISANAFSHILLARESSESTVA